MRATDAHLLRRYDMDGITNGMLTLTGGLRELFLSGGLEIRPFTLALEALLQEDIPTLQISNDNAMAHRQQAARQKWQWLPRINLNIELSAHQQAFLRGQGLEAELQGKVTIQGVYPDSVYRGSFKTVRGNVQILGKKFTLAGGEVRLENEVFSLLIPAVYQGKDIEVRAQLSGTVDELQLDLSSAPVYPEDEIVSRLLFNKSSRNISPLQAVRLANAIAILKFGGKPLFDPLGKIQKTLTVDSLNVEDAESGNGVMLGVGKYIHEKVYVEVETGTGAGEPWQGNIQIELLPNLNLENTINGETGFGNIELQWKKDY
jgi:translocation and assembly module TamB